MAVKVVADVAEMFAVKTDVAAAGATEVAETAGFSRAYSNGGSACHQM
jgi:hypothetical protein